MCRLINRTDEKSFRTRQIQSKTLFSSFLEDDGVLSYRLREKPVSKLFEKTWPFCWFLIGWFFVIL